MYGQSSTALFEHSRQRLAHERRIREARTRGTRGIDEQMYPESAGAESADARRARRPFRRIENRSKINRERVPQRKALSAAKKSTAAAAAAPATGGKRTPPIGASPGELRLWMKQNGAGNARRQPRRKPRTSAQNVAGDEESFESAFARAESAMQKRTETDGADSCNEGETVRQPVLTLEPAQRWTPGGEERAASCRAR